jgi:hypothetical protein
MVRVTIALLLLALLPSTARAEKRFALLVGNQGYTAKVGALKNPHRDIALVGTALEKIGFKTTYLRDAAYRSIDAAIKRHIAAVRREGEGAISIVYYSGHGAADPDTKINYLIPVDVNNADDAELWTYSLNLNSVVDALHAQAPAATHYVVFDACRNELNLSRKGKKELANKGFVPIAYTSGVMIAYATAPGKTATDAGTSGGPYARALADELVKPGIEALTMFRRVALRVRRELGQDPWMSASTLPEVYFAGLPKAPDETAWLSIRHSYEVTELQRFIDRYFQSRRRAAAVARATALRDNRELWTMSFKYWPDRTIRPGQVVTASADNKTLTCIGGDKVTPRICSFEAAPRSEPSEARKAWIALQDQRDERALAAFRDNYGVTDLFLDRLAEARMEELRRRPQ